MGNFEPINAAILVAIAIVLGWYLKDRFSAMDARMDDMTKHIAETKTLVAAQQGRIDELSREVVDDALRHGPDRSGRRRTGSPRAGITTRVSSRAV
jgi:hypothetical protein